MYVWPKTQSGKLIKNVSIMNSTKMYKKRIEHVRIICKLLTDANSVNFHPNFYINFMLFPYFGLWDMSLALPWGGGGSGPRVTIGPKYIIHNFMFKK